VAWNWKYFVGKHKARRVDQSGVIGLSVDIVTVGREARSSFRRVISRIRGRGMQAGVGGALAGPGRESWLYAGWSPGEARWSVWYGVCDREVAGSGGSLLDAGSVKVAAPLLRLVVHLLIQQDVQQIHNSCTTSTLLYNLLWTKGASYREESTKTQIHPHSAFSFRTTS